MPLQDLTPQLRTRLHRIEKTVGWFVSFAVLLLLAGFAFYLYSAAQRRGWFVTKLNYATGLNDATGLKAGDPIRLMGFNVGEITGIELNPPDSQRGATIFFSIREPYYGYIWWDSTIRVGSDFLGKRYLEVQKGKTGEASVYKDKDTGSLMMMNRPLAHEKFKDMVKEFRANPEASGESDEVVTGRVTTNLMALIKGHRPEYYVNAIEGRYNHTVNPAITNFYWVPAIEPPALSDQLAAVANAIEVALPNFLKLTNQVAGVLSNANLAVAQVHATLADTHPILTNLASITGHLREPNGSLGNWILPTNIASQLDLTLRGARETLQSAHTTLDDVDTNVTKLAADLDKTLNHLADLSSNLAWQVQINTNLVTDISTTIVHADDLIQGLKREWFLRSAFKKKKEKPKGP
ncbi:MAG TPA: MlaD family protein [Verrucomicrobiae bacterium]|jgi:ABC-type transporter Mla subunit MlaD